MSNARILIVDDDPALLHALPALLQRRMPGLQVDTVRSPQEGIERVVVTDYDALISDVKMPNMDGLNLLEEIHTLCPELPILLMTAYDEHALVVQALRKGAYDFIQKPIDEDYLVASLRRALQLRQLHRQVAEQQHTLARHADNLEQAVLRAVAEAEAAQRRLAFLAAASTLLASSLDYEITLERVARLAVLYLADYCVVDMLQPGGTLACVAVAHKDPAQERLVHAVRDAYPADPAATYPAWAVLETGQAAHHATITALLTATGAGDAAPSQLLHDLGVSSMMIVPLVAHDQILGAITFARTHATAPYTPADLELAEDLTRRAALAVENARLYSEAQQALHVRDQFLALASHELRTPMTAILGNAQLLIRRSGHPGNGELHDVERLRVLAAQIRHLDRLIVSMLDLTRLEAGRLTINPAPVNLVAVAQQVVDEMRFAIERHTIELSAGTAPLIIEGDALRLEQVLQNLLQNAIKYSPEGGPIAVRVAQQEGMAAISVSDQGIGIPATALPDLFTRFYRAYNVDAWHISGIGLGLYVVKEIVNLHGGIIEVTSVEGAGSTFTIHLPLSVTDEAAGA